MVDIGFVTAVNEIKVHHGARNLIDRELDVPGLSADPEVNDRSERFIGTPSPGVCCTN